MYQKTNFGTRLARHHEDVVVTAPRASSEDTENKSFDACLSDILSDMPTRPTQAEASIGRFDRVDIRTVAASH